MATYTPLETYLESKKFSEISISFQEIEKIIGTQLPPSARKHRAWWSNNPSNSVATYAWLNAGYKTERVDMASEKLVFRRTNSTPHPSTPSTPPKQKSRRPLFGILKGTVSFSDTPLETTTGERWDAQS